jgi:hypothetical protein
VADPVEPMDGTADLVALTPTMTLQDRLTALRQNALVAHQHAVGRGDKLVEILERAIRQMERTHSRVQWMSMVLFGLGVLLIVSAAGQVVLGGEALWGALMGAVGCVASLTAVFWTAPIDKMSASIADLVKLETAFLGYIRVIGEVDSAFQMQYLDLLDESRSANKPSLDAILNDTKEHVRDMMTHTLEMIDKHVGVQRPKPKGDGDSGRV